ATFARQRLGRLDQAIGGWGDGEAHLWLLEALDRVVKKYCTNKQYLAIVLSLPGNTATIFSTRSPSHVENPLRNSVPGSAWRLRPTAAAGATDAQRRLPGDRGQRGLGGAGSGWSAHG